MVIDLNSQDVGMLVVPYLEAMLFAVFVVVVFFFVQFYELCDFVLHFSKWSQP